jgi:hypothetical protein
MNKATWAAFKAEQYKNGFNVDPFEGLQVKFSSELPAYASATAGQVYAIVGDLGFGALANFPAAGESITIDGVAPSASNIRYDAASGAVYIYNVAAGKHTIALTVGTSRGFAAYSNTWNNVPVADAASLLPVSVYNGDDEEDVIRVSVDNGATWLEGQESKNISVGDGAEFPVLVKSTTSGFAKYRVQFRHMNDDEVSGLSYQEPGQSWQAVPANGIITPLQGCSSDTTRLWKFRANVAAQMSIELTEMPSNGGGGGIEG